MPRCACQLRIGSDVDPAAVTCRIAAAIEAGGTSAAAVVVRTPRDEPASAGRELCQCFLDVASCEGLGQNRRIAKIRIDSLRTVAGYEKNRMQRAVSGSATG